VKGRIAAVRQPANETGVNHGPYGSTGDKQRFGITKPGKSLEESHMRESLRPAAGEYQSPLQVSLCADAFSIPGNAAFQKGAWHCARQFRIQIVKT
jgi:phage portal protein BeeE